MQEMSSSSWLRRGSSIVFDQITLGPLISSGQLISLREALGWMNAWPDHPPEDASTLLISGLETSLDVLSPEDAETFLRTRVKPFIQEIQGRWDQCGIVFGFGVSAKSFKVTPSSEEVLFLRRDRKKVRLSYAMWDGSSTLNVTRLVRPGDHEGKMITVGFHVPRIS